SARRWRWILATCLAAASLGCASIGQDERDAVAVAAVNYTGKELNAVLFKDPQTGRVAGGSGADPYSASGGMCCYSLPRRWRPGIKVQVRYDWWTGSSRNRHYEYIEQELPPYPTDEPGMLWALFYEDGSVEVLASAVDPGHPQWPGRIKHWPIPSRERLLQLWQIEYDKEARLLRYYERMAKGFSDKERREVWDYYSKYWKEKAQGFDGPDDPRFIEMLKRDGRESLESTKVRLEEMRRNKP
uniref:DUF3304 domain-containing protein n=1 Tax=Caldimonas manganoxidans TaxID=196015 RepID=UPI000527DEEF